MTNKSNKPDKPNAVGYKKPPRHTQFQKGKSGNPAGRPKGAPNLATALMAALNEKVVVNENGQRRTISKFEAMVIQMVNIAVSGDARARQQLLALIREVNETSAAQMKPDYEGAETAREKLIQMLARIHHNAKEAENESDEKTNKG